MAIDFLAGSPDAKSEYEEEKEIEDYIDEAYDRMRDEKALAEYEAAEERAKEDGSVQYE